LVTGAHDSAQGIVKDHVASSHFRGQEVHKVLESAGINHGRNHFASNYRPIDESAFARLSDRS
jgi:hypothetical protein